MSQVNPEPAYIHGPDCANTLYLLASISERALYGVNSIVQRWFTVVSFLTGHIANNKTCWDGASIEYNICEPRDCQTKMPQKYARAIQN